jgi:predicted phosphoribosyltransferase
MAIADASMPWALRVAALSDQLVADLNTREHLVDVADRALQVARDRGCTMLLGASEVGRRIVEAAGQLDLQVVTPLGSAKVLLVDGLLITGTNVVAAADRVRRAGAREIAVFVALADQHAMDAVQNELGAEVVAFKVAG